jgi:hypothetical protein
MSDLLLIAFGSILGYIICNCINSIRVAALNSKVEEEEKKKEELNPTTIHGKYDTSISLYNIKKAKTYDGKDAIIVQHTFTNPNPAARKFYLNYELKLFQDDVELSSVHSLGEGYDFDGCSEHISVRNGATVIVEHAYVLRNQSNIEMEISDFNGKKYIYSIDINAIK